MLLLAGTASAASFTVCSLEKVSAGQTCDFDSLTEAADNVADNDVLRLTDGNFLEAAVIEVDITVEATAQSFPVLRGMSGDEAVITIRNADVTLVGLYFGVSPVRPIYIENSDVDLRRITVSSLAFSAPGGGIFAELSTVRVFDSTFQLNQADLGGHIWSDYSDVLLRNSVFTDGLATLDGGAVYAIDGQLELRDVVMSSNRAKEAGGAIGTLGTTELTTRNTLFTDNEADLGGAIADLPLFTFGAVPMELVDTIFEGNHAEIGGALALTAADLELDDVDFVDNSASQEAGAAAIAVYSTLLATDVRFCGNTAGDHAGALDFAGQGATLSRLRLLDNSAGDSGGGMRLEGEVGIERSNLLGNTAAEGGAIYLVEDATLTLQDSLVAWSLAGAGVFGDGALQGDHNAFFANQGGDAPPSYQSKSDVTEDPLLTSFQTGDGCEAKDWPIWVSPLRDAGTGLDPDGSPGDIGYYGVLDEDHVLWGDNDDDGTPLMYDCDDGDPAVHPDADEIWYDDLDSNCDRGNDFDQDADGWDFPLDCDDEDAAVNPGVDEEDDPTLANDGIDNDCNGNDDLDGDDDGYPASNDCDDTDRNVHPDAIDDDPTRDLNCDGKVDVEDTLTPRTCGGATPTWMWWLLLTPIVRRSTVRSRGRIARSCTSESRWDRASA